MQRQDRGIVDPLRPLIGAGGIDVAVADHPASRLDRRADRAFDMIGARGGKQQRFGVRAPACDLALHQQGADCLRTVAAARLAGNDDMHAAFLERSGQPAHLRRFTGALAAFQ